MKPVRSLDTSQLVRELFVDLRNRRVKETGIRRKPKIAEKTIVSLRKRLLGKNVKEAGVKFDALKRVVDKIPNKSWVKSFFHGADEAADMAANPIHDFAKLHPLHADSTYGVLSGKRVAPATDNIPRHVLFEEPLTPWNHAELQKVLGSNLVKNPLETTRINIDQAPTWIKRLPQKYQDAYVESMRLRLQKNPQGRMPEIIKYDPKTLSDLFEPRDNSLILGDPALTGGKWYSPYSSVFHESGHAAQEKALWDLGVTAKPKLINQAKDRIGHLFHSEGSPMFKFFEEQRANNLGYKLLYDYLSKIKPKHKNLYLNRYLNDMSRVNQRGYAAWVANTTPTHAVQEVIDSNTAPRLLPLLGMHDYNAAKNIGFLGHKNHIPEKMTDQWLEILAEQILGNKNLMQMLQKGRYNLPVPSR
jgi:hypothetical protein